MDFSFTSIQFQDFLESEISPLLSRAGVAAALERAEGIPSRVQQMNIISQRDKQGDKFKSS